MDIEVKTKRWGNSIGIIVPWEIVRTLKLKEGEQIHVHIERKTNPLKELYGSLKFSKKTDTLLAEIDQELEGKW